MNRLHSLVMIVASVVCATCVVLHAESGFAGKWQGATESGRPVALDLKVNGQQLTGKLTLARQIADITDGKAEEKTFSFKATVDSRTITITGRLAGDQLEMTVEGVANPLMLKRVK
jgi:hypothetical protein